VLAGGALVLGGCGRGGPDDRVLVRRAMATFARASAAKDYRTLCRRVLAPALVDQVQQVGLGCEGALSRGLGPVKRPQVRVGAISVHGSTATAAVHSTAANQPPSDDVLTLTRVNGQWRISALR
jgi:hypothetical protein